jgi:hypothetical protein
MEVLRLISELWLWNCVTDKTETEDSPEPSWWDLCGTCSWTVALLIDAADTRCTPFYTYIESPTLQCQFLWILRLQFPPIRGFHMPYLALTVLVLKWHMSGTLSSIVSGNCCGNATYCLTAFCLVLAESHVSLLHQDYWRQLGVPVLCENNMKWLHNGEDTYHVQSQY